jgi:hypothetical protein
MKRRLLKKVRLAAAIAGVALLAMALPRSAGADIASGGPPPERWSGLARFGAVSPDGRRVVFSSRQRLARGDRDRALDVYLRANGRTVLLSTGGGAGEAGERVEFEGATPDARTALLRTEDRLTAADDDSFLDLYRRGPYGLDLISASASGEDGWPRLGAVSVDGARVLFNSSERLVAADEDDRQDIYEYGRGRTRLVSVGAAKHVRFLAAAADGSRVIFSTSAGLVAADTDGHGDIYVRSAGVTTLLSGGDLASCPVEPGIRRGCPAEFVAASTDASRVFFETSDRLSPLDTDSWKDVYRGGEAGLELISTGPQDTNRFDARFAAITPDGRRAFFASGEPFGRLARGEFGALFERSVGRTSLVSIGKRGPMSIDSGESKSTYISRDGERVVFAAGGEVFMRTTGGVARQISGRPTEPFAGFGVFLLHGSATGDGRAVFVTVRRLDRRDRDNAYDLYGYGPRGIRVLSVGPLGGNASPSDPIGAFIYDVPTFGGATDDGRFVFFTSEERLIRADRDHDIDLYRRGPSGLSLVSRR